MQPAVGVDGDDVPGVGRDVLLARDVPQGREEALDSHGGDRDGRARGVAALCDSLALQDIGIDGKKGIEGKEKTGERE